MPDRSKEALDISSEFKEGKSWAEEVLETISDGVSIQNRELTVLWANKAHRDIFGDVMIGRPCYTIYERSPEPCRGCPVLEAFESRKAAFALRTGVDKYGESWWAEIAATPLFDAGGEAVAVVEVVRNVTERKLLEQAADARRRELTISEHRFRSLFEEAPVGMLALNRDGVVMAANKELMDMLGRDSKEGLVGEALSSIPSVRDAGLTGYVAKALKGERVVLEDVPFVSMAGVHLVISIVALPYLDDQGRQAGATVVVTKKEPAETPEKFSPKGPR